MAKELVSKMIDDNPYMTLYIEFLIAKKRNPELNNIMIELQEQTKEKFNSKNKLSRRIQLLGGIK